MSITPVKQTHVFSAIYRGKIIQLQIYNESIGAHLVGMDSGNLESTSLHPIT